MSTDRPLHTAGVVNGLAWPGCEDVVSIRRCRVRTCKSSCRMRVRCMVDRQKAGREIVRARVNSFFMESKRLAGCTIGRAKPCWACTSRICMSYGDSQCPCLPHCSCLLMTLHQSKHLVVGSFVSSLVQNFMNGES